MKKSANMMSSVLYLPSVVHIILSLVTGCSSYASEFGSPQHPIIHTKPNTYQKAVGEEATLWCNPQNLGNYVVLWKKDDTDILTAGKMMVKPDTRLSLVEYNLRIQNIQPHDGGKYTCYISTDGPVISVTHDLQILVPPRITAEPSDGLYVVKRGRRVALKCSATGNPTPSVVWTKKDGRLPSDEMSTVGDSLIIHSISKTDAGIYICSAENGIGQPAMAEINLQVLYPPEIELETNKVHTGENKEAHLTCIVQGNPEPKVKWYKGASLITESQSISFTSAYNRHTLVLRNIRSGLDFGNYSCIAENSMGTFKKHIEVHGRPTSPVFRSKPNTSKEKTYLLTWSVDSYSPIEEHRLLYRKIKPYHGPHDSKYPMGEGDWTNVIIPGDLTNMGFTHLRSYKISGLEDDSEYECLVQARNKFGWSEPSRLFTFYTSRPAPLASDLEWKHMLNKGSTTCFSVSYLIQLVVTALLAIKYLS